MERVILHCDLNSFYASVELLDHPELQGQPAAVCGDPESRHGVILAKNEPAKAFGIQTAETVWQARKKCPDLVLLPAHHDKYHRYSKAINAIYGRYTDLVQPFSIDESWLDLTGTLHLFHMTGRQMADHIRMVVQQELGLTISVGVSFNKTFAKMGSDYKKPNATTVITEENFRQILWPLPVQNFLFVGRAAAARLNGIGVYTIGDLAGLDRDAAMGLLGKQGGLLHDRANGIDPSPVTPASEMGPPKSVGHGLTFAENLLGWEAFQAGITLLSDDVAARLRRHDLKCTTVSITVRDPDFRDQSRQRALEVPTFLAREISQAAVELLSGFWDSDAPIRALTITASHLIPAAEACEQLNLLAPEASPRRDRMEKLERTMDSIRKKYGKSSISAASLKRKEKTDGTST